VRTVGKSRARSQIELVLTEGRKREVRRMLEAVGHPVIKLVRTRFGPIDVRGLKAGATRTLTPHEVGELQRTVGL
jgi:23S rRNA pseudouridine2605 synthase